MLAAKLKKTNLIPFKLGSFSANKKTIEYKYFSE